MASGRAEMLDGSLLKIRQFDEKYDLQEVQEVERRCEAGPNGSISLFADLLGDPLGRVRHFPVFTMLVAEAKLQIVGMIRAGIKDVVCGKTLAVRESSRFKRTEKRNEAPIYGRVGYVLGLRVSRSHRRMGVGQKLVKAIECWCKNEGAEYTYMATSDDNDASIKLFIDKLGYKILTTPSILVHPVFQHSKPISNSHARLTKLSINDSTLLYRSVMSTTHFFPKDIHNILASELYAGTWIATLKEDEASANLRIKIHGAEGDSGVDNVQKLMEAGVFKSWAILSVWRCNEIFRLQVNGVSLVVRSLAAMSRHMDRILPWLQIPSFPDIFSSFGMQFLFGLHAEGDKGHELLTSLFWHAHNLARQQKCQVIMSEVGSADPLINTIPHWKLFSSADDLWCIKRLSDPCQKDAAALSVVAETTVNSSSKTVDELEQLKWSHFPAGCTIFVDPRDV